MNGKLVSLEWLRLRRSRAAAAIFAFTLLTSLYALWSGLQWKQDYVAAQAMHERKIASSMEKWAASLTAIESGAEESTPYDARPMSVQLAATHAPGPLTHLAVGFREIMPSRLTISPWRNEISMIERYEFDNPQLLALGKFDFAFFVVVVLPVLMIALSFDVVASDITSGRARLLISHALDLRQVAFTRLVFRNGLLCGLVLLVMLIGLALVGAPVLESLSWLGICIAYMLFWFALIFFAVTRSQRPETVAAGLLACWLVLTFAIPALIETGVQALNPPPSKLAYLSLARSAEGEANRQTAELTEGFLADHPDLSVGDEEVPSYYRGTYLANERVREKTAPVAARFNSVAEARETSLSALQYLSPALLAQRALYQLAQADASASRRYLEGAGSKLEEISELVGPAVISRNRISLAQYQAVTPFRVEQHSAAPAILPEVLFLLLLAAGLGLVARIR